MDRTPLSADAIVVGAGPAGCTVAGLLAQRGHRVLLVDRTAFPRDKTCGDGLTPRAIPVLERLGLLGELETAGFQRITGARLIAPSGETWQMGFADCALGLPPYGLVVPRYELDARLLARAISQGARFLPGVNVTGPLTEAGSASINHGRDRAITGIAATERDHSLALYAPLTVLAVGANIGLLRAFGVLERMPAGINAIRGYFEGVADLDTEFEFYFERALAPGYAWVFPLTDGRANIGLGVFGRNGAGDGRNLRRLLDAFRSRWPRLRDAQPVGPPKGYPLRIDYPRYPAVGNGFLLVGEALGLVNPVTGEGIDLALESGELAAELADAALRRGDVSARGLRPYARALDRRYASFFRGVHLLLRLATGPHAMSILIRKAQRKPYLARLIAGINLGVASPWRAFAPRTWWDLFT